MYFDLSFTLVTTAPGWVGTRLPRMAALPNWGRMPSLPHRCLTASPFSCSVCRPRLHPASSLPLLPPHASHQRIQQPLAGRQFLATCSPPLLPHLASVGKGEAKPWYGSSPCHCTVATCRGFTTVTSRAASLSLHQLWIAGLGPCLVAACNAKLLGLGCKWDRPRQYKSPETILYTSIK